MSDTLEPTDEMLRAMFIARFEGSAYTVPWEMKEGPDGEIVQGAWRADIRADYAKMFAVVRDIVLEEAAKECVMDGVLADRIRAMKGRP